MRFKNPLVIPVYFETDISKAIQEDKLKDFNPDHYSITKIDFFSIEYIYEEFYDDHRKIFKYTVMACNGETFTTSLRKKEVEEKIKANISYE